MQGLVYIFIALAALGVAGAAYFGLTFTPIEAIVTAIAVGAIAVILMERQLRLRAEARLERGVEDLARLLSTDAQAGAALSQRINQLADTNAGSRLDGIEADISVLGTVVRQLAEAVAEMEERQRKAAGEPDASMPMPMPEPLPPDEDAFPEPVIPIEMLKQALDDNRLVCHIEPLAALPQRRPYGYDIVPRLMMEDAELADAPDFMPRHGKHADVVQRIEAMTLEQAIVIARRAKTSGQPIRLYIPLTRVTIADAVAAEQMLAVLDANRAIAEGLNFMFSQAEWKQLVPSEKTRLAHMGRLGVGFSLTNATSLRFDFGELENLGFATVRVDTTRFLNDTEQFTDFHIEDVAAYARRFRMEIVGAGVIDEQQLLTLFEEGFTLAQGPYIAKPGPVRPDLIVERGAEPALRRVEV